MLQQFYQHQPVQTVAVPQRGQNIRIWLTDDGETVRPMILEGVVRSVDVYEEDGNLQFVMIDGLDGVIYLAAAGDIGSIELIQ